MPYLIDGHNLIARLPDISLDDPNDEAKLVTRLRGFVAGGGKRCTVVFDGGLPGGQSSMSNMAVRVVFAAAQHSNADAVIKRLMQRVPDAGNWTVVSSDHDILNAARSQGMRQLTAGEFAQLLRSSGREEETRGEEVHPTVTTEEIDELFDAFGGEPDG